MEEGGDERAAGVRVSGHILMGTFVSKSLSKYVHITGT